VPRVPGALLLPQGAGRAARVAARPLATRSHHPGPARPDWECPFRKWKRPTPNDEEVTPAREIGSKHRGPAAGRDQLSTCLILPRGAGLPAVKTSQPMPSVDIAIPCYNYAHLLPQCVESVLSQGLSEIRITIIDNASEDDSVAVARKLAAGDRRVEVVCHACNVGAHASFNEAIDRADADYFMILCADDLLAAGMLRAGVEALERHPEATVLLGRSDPPFVGDQPPAPQEARAARLTHRDAFLRNACDDVGCGIAAYTMLVRTSVQKTVGHYDSSIRHYDDMEMALRLAARGSVIELDAPLGLRRLHDTNISAALWQDRLLDLRERQ